MNINEAINAMQPTDAAALKKARNAIHKAYIQAVIHMSPKLQSPQIQPPSFGGPELQWNEENSQHLDYFDTILVRTFDVAIPKQSGPAGVAARPVPKAEAAEG